jgi:hypothetical protein
MRKITLVIISVLIIIAISKSTHQISSVRRIALDELASALNTAVMLVQTEYRAEGNSDTSTVTRVKMDGTVVIVLAGSGFPDAVADGIGAALHTLSGFTPVYTKASGKVIYNFSKDSVADCHVVYTASKGIAVAITSGC